MTSLSIPLEREPSLFREIALTLGANLSIALLAKGALFLPFSPVPLALQVSWVLLLAAHLEKRHAMGAILLFLLEGALGLPVFAGGLGGLPILLGPRGGYLLGYAVATWVTATWREKQGSLPMALFLGNLTVYLCGWSQLSLFIGGANALLVGILPFLAGDLLKLIAGQKLFSLYSRR